MKWLKKLKNGWIRRLRDRTLDYTGLVTHFEDGGDERGERELGKQGGKRGESGKVWENNPEQRGVESSTGDLHV